MGKKKEKKTDDKVIDHDISADSDHQAMEAIFLAYPDAELDSEMDGSNVYSKNKYLDLMKEG